MEKPNILIEENFVEDPDRLFAWFLKQTTWDLRMKARLTASFGQPYDYAGISYPEAPMPVPLQQICERLHGRLGFRPNNCLVNYYPDGNSKMGFHADSIDELADRCGVAIIVLGAERPLRFRRIGDISVRFEVTQPKGSLLYMEQETNRDWVHAIPKQRYAEPRISLTFRRLKPGI